MAKDSQGRIQKDIIKVENQEALLNMLKQQELYCIRFKEKPIKKKIKAYKISLKQLVTLCRQLATMLDAGISMMKCIDILYQQTEEPKLKGALLNIYEDIQRGHSLSSSLQTQERVFPKLLIGMVKCGEESGSLDRMFFSLAKHYESENKLQNKLKNAMVYPSILGIISFVVVIFLLLFVVPTFAEMFGDYGELPTITQFLLSISHGLQNYWLIIIWGGLSMFIGIYFSLKTITMKRWIDQFKLTIPIIGKLNKVILSARFAQTISTLYASGMSIIQVMEITQSVMNNSYMDQKFNKAKEVMSKGIALSEAMREMGIFPPILSHMVLIGEESGHLEEILDKTATFYHEEADAATQKMIALLEPTMIIFLGIIVVFIIGAILPPMYEMMGNIQ